MSSTRPRLSACFSRLTLSLVASAGLAHAVQIETYQLVSPITGQRFESVGIARTPIQAKGPADMGADDDGCRHTAGVSEYEYYVTIDPHSYFAALTEEWNPREGRFLGEGITPQFRDWVIKQYNVDRQANWNHQFDRAVAIARSSGQPIPDRKAFVMPQSAIALAKRYKCAIECYEKRGARAAILGKIALNGAWAMRCYLNKPVNDPSWAGGFQEVDNQVQRHIKDGGEDFALKKWLGLYRQIFNNASLTDEGYLVAGMVYTGFTLRDGDGQETDAAFAALAKRFKPEEQARDGKEIIRGLIRERRLQVAQYRTFLDAAQMNLSRAIRDEEFNRHRLPTQMLAVAECLRRLGRHDHAMDWYIALAQMPESRQKMRDDARAEGRAPGPDADLAMQVGWLADGHIAALKKLVPGHPDAPNGPDRAVLDAIIHEGLGTPEYKSPLWKAATGATATDCGILLDLVGKDVLIHKSRIGYFPKTLDDLWMHDITRDRNRVNRFCCPATGEPFAYKPLPETAESASPKTIVVATTKPMPTPQGDRYAAFLANGSVVWMAELPAPGTIHGAR